MASDKVVAPTTHEVRKLSIVADDIDSLVSQARASDEADKHLTIRQALKHYKAATFWAMILSTSLIMEGFDLVTVGPSRHPDVLRTCTQLLIAGICWR